MNSPNNFHNNGVVDTVTMEFNLGFKIGQDDSYNTIPPLSG
jgi:hypothetical protein